MSFQKGRKLTEEHKNKLKESRRLFFKNGGISGAKGKKFPYKPRPTMKGKLVGSKNPAWKGGTQREKMLRSATRPKPEKCEICGTFGKNTGQGLHFDHNHNTGGFRGWICFRCNAALGLVKDNVGTLQEMINYLIKYQ